jgi:AraC-like DNA-binding protein
VTVIVDTTTVPLAERNELWTRAHVEGVPYPVEVRVTAPGPIRGSLVAHAFGPAAMFRDRGEASTVRGVPGAGRGFGVLNLTLVLAGRLVIHRASRVEVIGVGDLVMWDPAASIEFMADAPYDVLTFCLPKLLLGSTGAQICERLGTRTPGDRGMGAVAATFLRRVWAEAESAPELVSGPDVADCVAALSRALHAPVCPLAETRNGHSSLLEQLRAHAEAQLADPGLSVASLARAHAISERYVQKLFAADGCSVSEWVRARRLERVRRDLLDPRLASEPIAAIAARWGLRHPSYFSRIFREAYGLSPSEARELGTFELRPVR